MCWSDTLVATLPDYTVSKFRHNSVGLTCLPEILLEVDVLLEARMQLLQQAKVVRVRYVWFQQLPLVALIHRL